MLTSGQIAAQMAGQNQYFAGAAQYSRQISAQMPGAYGGGIGQAQFAPVPGGLSQSPGFSYGGGGSPNGFTNQVGGQAMSALGGMANFGMGAAGIAAGFGMLGRGGSMLLDPFAGGGMGWKLGGRIANAAGMGRVGGGLLRLGMGAAGMLPAAGVLAAGSHIVGSMMEGAQEQSAVNNVMSRHQFIMPGMGNGPGGGVSRQGMRSVGDMMKGMEALPEMMTSMSELTRIMDKMGQMGVMQGAQNVQEFKNKFKENIKVLKDMSKVMQTSMEEALPMFGEIRRSGFYNTGDILKNAMNRQITSGTTGMSTGQVNQVAQYGAQVNWSQGGGLKQGSQHALRVANQLGAARKLGLLTEEQIMEHTGGVGGAEGLQMMSTEMVGLSHKMARGQVGMVASVALGEMKDGRFTGKMDEDLMKRFRQGEFSMGDLHRMAGKRKNRKAAMSYYAHDKAMRANLASGMGVEGTVNLLRGALGDRGFNDPSALNLMAQRFGMSQRQAELLPMMGRMGDIQAEMRQSSKIEARRIARESFMKENYSWDAVKSKAKKKIQGVVTEPFKKMGRDLSGAINDAVDEFVDDITGQYESKVSREVASLVRDSMSGARGSSSRLSGLMKSSQGAYGLEGALGGGVDMTPGTLGDISNAITGNVSAGDRMSSLLGMVGGGKYTTKWTGSGFSAGVMQGMGVNVLSKDTDYFGKFFGFGERNSGFVGSTNEQLRAGRQALQSLASGEGTAISKEIGEMLSADGGAMGKAATAKLSSILSDDLGLQLMSGEDRIKTISKRMKGDKTFDALMKKAGAGSELDVLAAIEKYSGGKLGSGISSALRESASGLSGFRNLKDVNDRRQEVEKKLSRALGDDLGGEFLALSDKSITDKSMDLVFGGMLGDTSDMAKELGKFSGNRMYKGEVLKAVGGLSDEDRDLLNKKGMGGLLRKYASADAAGVEMRKSKAVKKLIAMQGKSYKTLIGQQHAKSILLKKADGQPLDDEDKAFLKERGMDISSLEGSGGKKRAKDLLNLLAKMEDKGLNDPEVQSLMKEHRDLNVAASLSGISQQLKEEGESLGDKVGALIKTEGENSVLTELKGAADLMVSDEISDLQEALGASKGGRSVAQRYAAAGMAALSMDDKKREALLGRLGDANLSAAVAKGQSLKRNKQLQRGKATLGDIIPQWESMSEEMQNKYLSIATGAGDKAQGAKTRIDKSELEEFMKAQMAEQASKGLARGGTEEMSKYANPAEIAAHMKSFGESAAKLAGYVSNMPAPEGAPKTDGKKR